MNFRVTDSVRKEPSAPSRMTWCGLLSRRSRRRDARGSSRKLAEVRSSTNSSPESIPHSSSQRANGSKDTERVTTLSWRRFASLRSWPDVYRKTATLRNESAKRLNPSGIGFVSAAKIFPFWSKNPPSPNVPKFTRTSWNEFWNKKRLLDVTERSSTVSDNFTLVALTSVTCSRTKTVSMFQTSNIIRNNYTNLLCKWRCSRAS